MLLFEIPEELKPALPPTEQLSKYDSNHSIHSDWVKIVFHIFKDGKGLLNLPRVLWVNKKWNLQELHLNIFDYYKDLMIRWYKEIKEQGKSNKSQRPPDYKHPDTGEALNYDSLMEMIQKESLAQQYKTFFPAMFTKEYQSGKLKRSYSQSEMIYFLKVENTSSYRQNCHYCETSSCTQNCPLPFDDSITVLDLLHKTAQEDNISFYHNERGKSDFILNLVWASEFETPL